MLSGFPLGHKIVCCQYSNIKISPFHALYNPFCTLNTADISKSVPVAKLHVFTNKSTMGCGGADSVAAPL